jgi:hypothetical protein
VIGGLRAIGIFLTLLGLAACTATKEPAEPSSSAAVAISSVAATANPPPAETGTSNRTSYGVTTTSIDGFSPDGLGTWKASRVQLLGGDSAVTRAFNDASQAVLRGQLARAIAGAREGSTPWMFESNGQVTFRRVVIAQVITSAFYFGAHPSSEAGTVVIDSRTARPVTLADVFRDERAGLKRLSQQTKMILPKVNGWNGVMPDAPGNAPVRENFANWAPTADGMELHFAPNQFGLGLAETIVVPWSQLTDLLAPNMADIAKT